MSRLCAIFVCVLPVIFSVSLAQAETRYIRTVVKITLRTGPGTDHKIISMIQSGDPIDVLENRGGWSKIRTAGGKEGWVLSNLITSEKPSQFIPPSRMSNTIPLEQQATMLEENKTLKAENIKLKAALSKSEAEMAQMRVSLGELKTASVEYDNVKTQLKSQTEKIKTYESQMVDHDFNQNMWWFLIGAGIILIGFIIGYNVKRPRPRPLLR